MKKEIRIRLVAAMVLLTAFGFWTAIVQFVDVQAIGPQGSAVGLATINAFAHALTGVNMRLYLLTDWLSLIPIAIALGFAILGLVQWLQRKKIWKVDYSILLLGGFYIVVFSLYLFFEYFVVNYRPVLIDGVLEGSYPSSTTLLVLCMMPTAQMQLRARIQNAKLEKCVRASIIVFTVLMVAGRLLSGVHWLSDIIGGALLSAGLVTLYDCISRLFPLK